MKTAVASGLGLALATVNFLVAAIPAAAQLPFEACLTTADALFRDGSASELAAIAACQGTAEPENIAACIELADSLWFDGSASEITGIEACRVRRRWLIETDLEPFQLGAYATCLRQAETSTHDNTPRELTAISACSGLTQPAEVAPCLSLAESLWHDETEAELAALSACRIALD
ncbi:hypothetical protein IQ254_18690 [Nodosilinea sp. LEGE 07088]|uniref:hypothetical protein n=1 Tax=Nodosilinea sp. LEGE 07088 TaxID=2777968 RepID=UPI001882FA88|nr:hypothetical protein [Nodosilinea sp. LEGE 07088]MBE9139198.1 hypothetical protein [Nodosilinea sp. LEGE 07088]